MPRTKFRSSGQSRKKGQKNFQRKNQFNKHGGQKRKAPDIDPVARKYKFIRQNQENEESLRRQKELEKNFQEKTRASNSNLLQNNDVESSSEEEADPMEELMSTLAAGGQRVSIKTNKAIESSESESESDGDGDLDDDDDDDDIFPEKFEEQSQPRGIVN